MMENLSSFFLSQFGITFHSSLQLIVKPGVLHVVLGQLTANQHYWEVNPAMILFHHTFIVIIYAYSYLVIYLPVCPLLLPLLGFLCLVVFLCGIIRGPHFGNCLFQLFIERPVTQGYFALYCP